MNEHQRNELLSLMESGSRRLEEVTQGLSEEQARFRPDQNSWSILDCAEHLAVAERGLLYLVMKMSRPLDEREVSSYTDEGIRQRQLNRIQKIQAPEVARPTGRFTNLEEALGAFSASRQKTVEFVKSCSEDLHRRVTNHPVAGTITCYQCLLLLSLHPQRHCEQIVEVRRAPGFPS